MSPAHMPLPCTYVTCMFGSVLRRCMHAAWVSLGQCPPKAKRLQQQNWVAGQCGLVHICMFTSSAHVFPQGSPLGSSQLFCALLLQDALARCQLAQHTLVCQSPLQQKIQDCCPMLIVVKYSCLLRTIFREKMNESRGATSFCKVLDNILAPSSKVQAGRELTLKCSVRTPGLY